MLTSSKKQLLPKELIPTWLKVFIIVLLGLGIFFRIVNLEQKVYWHDEAYTGLRISGYTKNEFVQQTFNGRIIGVDAVRKYQYPNPEKGVTDTIKSLASEDTQHPPLYYVLVRFWVQIFGHSVAVARSLSAIISLFTLGCIYWLCLELFKSPLIAWINVALVTVSPLHVLYSQEARQFSLWVLITLLGSATLLRAMRLGSKRFWGIYAVTVALGLYTFLFSGLVTLAHGIYLFAIERFRFTKTTKAYLATASIGFLAFLPWIFVVTSNLSTIKETTLSAQNRQSISAFVTGWISNISYLFGDFWRYEPFFPDLNLPILRWGRYLVPLLLLLVIFSFYFLYCKTEKRVWLFIFALCGIPAFTLIISDIIIGGKLSLRSRYVFPCYLGIQLALAYLFATQIISRKVIQRRFWRLVFVAVLTTGIVSCAVSSQAETWWNKGSHANPQISRIVNSSPQPLLISSNYSLNIGDILSLSHLLNSNVRMMLVTEPNVPEIPHGFSNVFLYNPSKKLQSELEQKFHLENVYKSGRLWRLEKI